MPWVSWGNITGTTGRKLRIEGININLSQDTVHSLTGTITVSYTHLTLPTNSRV